MTAGVAVGVGLLALIAIEQLLMVRGVGAYYAIAFPVPVEPLPIPEEPEGSGRTRSVRWRVHDREVRFFSGTADAGLVGLHGTVQLVRDRGRVRLVGRWAPPWSLIAFAFAVGAWGTLHGAAFISVAVAAAIVLGAAASYQAAAVQAMAELRFSFVRDDPPDDDG